MVGAWAGLELTTSGPFRCDSSLTDWATVARHYKPWKYTGLLSFNSYLWTDATSFHSNRKKCLFLTDPKIVHCEHSGYITPVRSPRMIIEKKTDSIVASAKDHLMVIFPLSTASPEISWTANSRASSCDARTSCAWTNTVFSLINTWAPAKARFSVSSPSQSLRN